VKIGDFGTSKKMDNTNAFTNTSLGTPYYLSPEICKGESYNFKSDNWMIGCVLFQLMTLDLPFKGINLPNLMKSIINDNVPNITINYSDELKNICYNLLKKKMKERISIKDIVSKNFVKEKIKNLNIYFDNNNNYNIMNISNFNNYYFSRKETVEDKSINIINDFTPIDLIRQSKSHINENNKKKKFNDNSLTIPEISINYSNSDNFTGPETPKIKEKEKERKKSIISNYSLTKNMYLNYNNNVNRGVSPNKFSVNNLKNDYSHSPNKRDKQIVLEGSFEEDDEKMKKNKLNK
jgi:serine/threonine protein kinase